MMRLLRWYMVFTAAGLGLFTVAGLAMGDTIQVRVSASTDDDEEHLTEANALDTNSSDLELGAEGGGTDVQDVGIRFQNVGIPVGATINSAFVQFAQDEADSVATSLRIYGELSPNAATYGGAPGSISSRPRTAAYVDWNDIPPWPTENEAGPNQRTPDLSPIVQEIVGQAGWAAGNALALVITANPGGERTAESWDGDPALAPLLTVDFTPIPEPSTVVLAGLGLMALVACGWRRRSS